MALDAVEQGEERGELPGSWIPRRGRAAWLAALALAAAFCFTGLSNHPLRAADEPRVAGIGWEMAHGEGAPIPHLGGEPFLEHPPLYYAVLGGFIDAFGAHEGVVRLPSAIAAFLTLILVFDLGRRIASPLAGLSSVLVLASMRLFVRYSHKVVVDPFLTLFVMVGFYLYVRAVWAGGERGVRGDERGVRGDDGGAPVEPGVPTLAILGIYLAAALAFYVKGFVGIIALAGPLAIDALAFRRFRVLKSAGHVVGIPLLLCVCASWPALLYIQGGETALREFLIQNGLYRILPGAGVGAGSYQGGHVQPFWYYLGQLPGLLTLWLAFLPAVAIWISRRTVPDGWSAGAIRFLGLVFPMGMLLLSIPGTKRELYLLPFIPPLSIAIGAWMAAMCRPDLQRSLIERVVALLSMSLGSWRIWPAAAHAAQQRLRRAMGMRIGRRKPALEAQLHRAIESAATGRCLAPARLAWVAFAGALAWNVLGYPWVDRDRDLGPTSREIVTSLAGEPLVSFSLPEEMLGALPFYTGRIPLNLRSDAALASYLCEHPDLQLLSVHPGEARIQEAAGQPLTPAKRWGPAERGYAIYDVPPQLQSARSCEGRTGTS